MLVVGSQGANCGGRLAVAAKRSPKLGVAEILVALHIGVGGRGGIVVVCIAECFLARAFPR